MTASPDGHVLAEPADGILVVTLNKPARLNAWDAPMRARLLRLILDAGHDPEVRGIVLTGAGERAFCAGQDLNEGQSFDGDRSEEWIEEWRRLYGAIRRFEKPFVVALNGLCAGSAFQVALLADLRVGHPGVRMGQPEINSGLPSITGFWIIREILGLSRATDLVLTGRMLQADECERLALIHRLVPQADVRAAALAAANELAAKAPLAFRLTKGRICAATQVAFDEAFEAARQIHRRAFEAGEPQQVMERFLARPGTTPDAGARKETR